MIWEGMHSFGDCIAEVLTLTHRKQLDMVLLALAQRQKRADRGGYCGFSLLLFSLGVFQESKGHKAEPRTWLLDIVQALGQSFYLKSDLE